jgi:lipoprotein-anchoring transpeptidase ErfK/SrfK
MDGESTVREIAPVGVGIAIDTGDYISTQTGLFYVHTKTEALVYDAPFDTYISHWVGFDAEKDNGFHSFLKNAEGAVVDASSGRVSNGCIRTGEPDAIFAYAEIGMPVWVHW